MSRWATGMLCAIVLLKTLTALAASDVEQSQIIVKPVITANNQIAIQPSVVEPVPHRTLETTKSLTENATRLATKHLRLSPKIPAQAAKKTNPYSPDELNRKTLEAVAPGCVGIKGKALQSCIDNTLKGLSATKQRKAQSPQKKSSVKSAQTKAKTQNKPITNN